MNLNLTAALLDVRKSYRLLSEYHQRQFELLAYIREKLGASHYYQEFNLPRPMDLRGMENQPAAGLRFLPFFDLTTIWLRLQVQGAHNSGDLMFGAWIRSDTGYDKYEGKFDGRTAEACQSLLVLSAVVCDQPKDEPFNWYQDVWCPLPYPSLGNAGKHDDVPGYRVYADSIDLASLGDQQAVNTTVDSWIQAASSALNTIIGVPLDIDK